MPSNDPGFWASLLAWLYTHKNESGYAVLAAVMAILRSTYVGRDSWPRRIVDGCMCGMFAFFLKPTCQALASIFGYSFNNDFAWVVAIVIGYLGVDFIGTKLRNQIDKRLGGSDANG
ncbi:TPA: phage holin, lambda family [Klebsiella aerogenes]|nr:phage holin, lambda family [Klebsiella aerogenes]